MTRSAFILIVLNLLCSSLYSQVNSTWYYGTGRHGIDFSDNPPSLTHSGMESLGATLIASKRDGSMLFYSDGDTIWDSNHQVKYVSNLGYSFGYSKNNPNLVLDHNALLVKDQSAESYLWFTGGLSSRGYERLGYREIVLNNGSLSNVEPKITYLSSEPVQQIFLLEFIQGNASILVARDLNRYMVYLIDQGQPRHIASFKHSEYNGDWTVKSFFSNAGWISISQSKNNNSAWFEGLKVIEYKIDFRDDTIQVNNRSITSFHNSGQSEPRLSAIVISPNDTLAYLFSHDQGFFYNGSTYAIMQRDLSKDSTLGTTFLVPFTPGISDAQLTPSGEIYICRSIGGSDPSNWYFDVIKYPNKTGTLCSYRKEQIRCAANIGWRDMIQLLPNPVYSVHPVSFRLKGFSCDKQVYLEIEVGSEMFDSIRFYVNGEYVLSTRAGDTLLTIPIGPAGRYEISLNALNNDGYSQWFSDTIVKPSIYTKPQARFSTRDTMGCQYAGFEIFDMSVMDSYDDRAYRYWSFGDGTDSMVLGRPKIPILTKTYTKPGHYTISQIVSNGVCSDTFSLDRTIEIIESPKPGISIQKDNNCAPSMVLLKNQVEDQELRSVQWRIRTANNSIFTDTIILNPEVSIGLSFEIQKPGTYLIEQLLTGPSGCITRDSALLTLLTSFGLSDRITNTSIKVIQSIGNDLIWDPAYSYKLSWDEHLGADHYIVKEMVEGRGVVYKSDSIHSTEFSFPPKADITEGISVYVEGFDVCGKRITSDTVSPILLVASQTSMENTILNWTGLSPFDKEYEFNYDVLLYKDHDLQEILVGNLDDVVNTFNHEYSPVNKYSLCYRISARGIDDRLMSLSNVACVELRPVIFIPNAFSPNNDGLNDLFRPVTIGIESYDIFIYNSWGQLIYSSNKNSEGWNGSYLNEIVPTGLYMVQIEAMDVSGKLIIETNTVHVVY